MADRVWVVTGLGFLRGMDLRIRMTVGRIRIRDEVVFKEVFLLGVE